MKRAASTPHAVALPHVSIHQSSSLHGENLYTAYADDQRIKNRSAKQPRTFLFGLGDPAYDSICGALVAA